MTLNEIRAIHTQLDVNSYAQLDVQCCMMRTLHYKNRCAWLQHNAISAKACMQSQMLKIHCTVCSAHTHSHTSTDRCMQTHHTVTQLEFRSMCTNMIDSIGYIISFFSSFQCIKTANGRVHSSRILIIVEPHALCAPHYKTHHRTTSEHIVKIHKRIHTHTLTEHIIDGNNRIYFWFQTILKVLY